MKFKCFATYCQNEWTAEQEVDHRGMVVCPECGAINGAGWAMNRAAQAQKGKK